MTDAKPPAQFDWAAELSDVDAHVTLSAQEAKEIGARLRSMGAKLKTYEGLGDSGSDVQLLRMGYAAARLEIESLKSQLAEHASNGQAPADAKALAEADRRAARAPADSVLEDAARYRWLREGNDAKHGAAWHVAVNLYGCEWDAAIDAAMNKGGAT